jgi:hypothetical protein
MNIPRYWARAVAERPHPRSGLLQRTSAFGSSNVSVAEALRDGTARAQRVVEWLCSSRDGNDPDRYPYGSDRPLREAIIREFGGGSERIAAITRNGQGALVLNTSGVMFIDIDDAPLDSGSSSLFSRVFGGKKPVADRLETARTALKSVAGLGGRLYRTAAGWRCLVTSALFDPRGHASDALLERCSADPRYRKLCTMQRSYRARLTPKPWRVGLRERPPVFPFESAAAEGRFASWLREYDSRAAGYAACELVETFGPTTQHPLAAAMVREHDALACKAGKPLA